jgi:hypothetical protein
MTLEMQVKDAARVNLGNPHVILPDLHGLSGLW